MNLFTFSSSQLKSFVLVMLLAASILYANNLVINLLPDNRAITKSMRYVEYEKTPELILMGNSSLFKNLGDSSQYIDAALSKKLGRPVHVRIIGKAGSLSDWFYLILQKLVIPDYQELPIVWFFWTGMPLEPGREADSSLLFHGSDNVILGSNTDSLGIGRWLKENVALFRASSVSAHEFQQLIQNLAYAAFYKYFPNRKPSSQEELAYVLSGMNPLKTGSKFRIVRPGQVARRLGSRDLSAQLLHFDQAVTESLFPKIDLLIRQNNLDVTFFEVTTQSLSKNDFSTATHFQAGSFTAEDFFSYRQKQNDYLRSKGYRVLSAIQDERFSQEMFSSQLYVKGSSHEEFSAIVADMLIEKGLIR